MPSPWHALVRAAPARCVEQSALYGGAANGSLRLVMNMVPAYARLHVGLRTCTWCLSLLTADPQRSRVVNMTGRATALSLGRKLSSIGELGRVQLFQTGTKPTPVVRPWSTVPPGDFQARGGRTHDVSRNRPLFLVPRNSTQVWASSTRWKP